MYIKKIELENIKRYEKAEIEFSSGLNFICGKNGAGKTTIIESIGYALFGFQNASKGFANYIVRKGEKKGKIRITFLDKDNNELIVDRKVSITTAGNSWSVRKIENGEEIEVVSGTIEVPAYLKDHLEFYPDDDISKIYEKIVSVPQGEMTAAFFLSDKNRKEEFDPLFKLDTYRRAFERIKLVRDIESENIEIDKVIANLEGEIVTEAIIKEEKKVKDEQLKLAERELKDFESGERKTREKFEVVDKLKKDIDAMTNKTGLKNAERKTYVTVLEMNDKNLKEANEAVDILKANEESYKKYLSSEKRLQELEQNFKKYEAIYNDIQELHKRVANGNTKVSERENNLKKQIEDINKAKAELEKENVKLASLNEKLKELGTSKAKSDDESDKKIDMSVIKAASEKVIELETNINLINKDLKDSLVSLNMPNKEILYLNKANTNMNTLVDKVDDSLKNIAVETKQNIEKAIEISKSNSTNNTKGTEELVKEKNDYENQIKELVLKYVLDDELIHEFNENNIAAREVFSKYISNAEKNVNEQSNEKTKCETEIKASQSIIEKTTNDIKAKEESYNKEDAEKKKWMAAIKDIENKINAAKGDLDTYEKIKKEIEEVKEGQKLLKEAYEKYVQNSKKKDEAEKYKVIKKENDLKLATCDEELAKLDKEFKELSKNFDEEEYQKLKDEYEKTKAGSKVILEKINHYKQEIERQTATLKHFKEVRETIKAKKKERKENVEVIEILKKLRKVINEAPEVIANMLIKNISNRASIIYADIASDTNRLEWENSYELSLYDYINGNEIKKEFKQLSGGEQMSAALSVRVAMLELLTNLKIGILDEPTTNIDSVRRERLAEIVGRVAENFNQLFVVSHDDTFENITQNVVMLKGGDE